uniref:Uncharacterized protein n=1 Tax=Strongyloides papillosus TaxID=174720 RepID=A0A0N5BQT9_STREA
MSRKRFKSSRLTDSKTRNAGWKDDIRRECFLNAKLSLRSKAVIFVICPIMNGFFDEDDVIELFQIAAKRTSQNQLP